MTTIGAIMSLLRDRSHSRRLRKPPQVHMGETLASIQVTFVKSCLTNVIIVDRAEFGA